MKLGVRYDKTLNDNVFVVRDDETYVSSTKTILSVGEPYFSDGDYLNYNVDLSLNVLRDTGESKIVLYDGDNALKAYDWVGLSIPDTLTFPVNTSHGLRAVFMGNAHCLKSQSKLCPVYQEGSDYPVSISLVSPSPVIIDDDAVDFTFKLRDSAHSVDVPFGDLVVSYTDGVHNDTTTTTVEDGDASVSFPSLENIDKGRIDFTVVYEGNTNYGRSIMGFSKSKYFVATLSGYNPVNDDRFIAGEDYTLVGKMLSFIDDKPYNSFGVKIEGYVNGSWVTLVTGQNNATTGEFRTTLSGLDYTTDYTQYRYSLSDDSASDEFKAYVTPSTIVHTTNMWLTPDYIDYKNMGSFYVDVIKFDPSQPPQLRSMAERVPVHVTNSEYNINDTFITDNQGRVRCSYPNLPRTTTLTIRSGHVTETFTINHYLTYYVAPTLQGRGLEVKNITKQGLPSGQKYTANNPTLANPAMIYPFFPEELRGVKQKFSFTVVSSVDSQFYYAAIDTLGQVTLYQSTSSNYLGTGDVCEYIYDPKNNELICMVECVNCTVPRERFRVDLSNGLKFPCIVNINQSGSLVLNNIVHEVLD